MLSTKDSSLIGHQDIIPYKYTIIILGLISINAISIGALQVQKFYKTNWGIGFFAISAIHMLILIVAIIGNIMKNMKACYLENDSAAEATDPNVHSFCNLCFDFLLWTFSRMDHGISKLQTGIKKRADVDRMGEIQSLILRF